MTKKKGEMDLESIDLKTQDSVVMSSCRVVNQIRKKDCQKNEGFWQACQKERVCVVFDYFQMLVGTCSVRHSFEPRSPSVFN